ncbi:MAG: hypothetical protein HC908_01710 [Calothrix sp. SM1_7_51]|nr:hypothetical protein [Calothrix sp. SM1_7_51]
MPIGINLNLSIGPNNPRPAPDWMIEAVDKIQVTQSVDGKSGFQITLMAGRSSSGEFGDDKLLSSDLLNPFNRVILTVTFGAIARVLMDGIITRQEFTPSLEPGSSILTITGEDVSVMMDLEEKSVEHPGLSDQDIVNQIISQYSQYGLTPKVSSPPIQDRPPITERIPVQQGSDLEYIKYLAERYAFLFYIIPGPTSGTNSAYWGPPQLSGSSQKALTVNMGSFSNVEKINLQINALAPTKVTGRVQDRKTNQIQSVSSNSSTRNPLSQEPALTNQRHLRTTQFRETGRLQSQGNSRAQGMLNRSVDKVITVTGTLSITDYGDILTCGKTVDLRGVGYTYDGRYFVNSVTHSLQDGRYMQDFILTREGLGTTIQQVAAV